MKIPVTVIIPTLNCREKAAQHLDAIAEWLPCVQQIIAIDSNSSDGTRELLEERLQSYDAKIISTGRGLYKCWNHAARHATQPYLYYSTICDIITKDGLIALAHLIDKNSLDVIISPPRVVCSGGSSIERVKWPVHYLEKYFEFRDGVEVLTQLHKDLLVTSFLPATVLGSSASNLYRTEVLQKNPFPEEVGNVGDSLWAVRNLPRLAVGIVNQRYATFCWDGVRNGTWDESGEIMKLFRNEARKVENGPHTIGYVNDNITDECVRLQAAVNEYDAYVKFLTRPFAVKARDVLLKYTSVRYWLGRVFSRE